MAIAAALGGPDLLLRSVATKSATAAISMAVAHEIGGDPALAAGLAVLTGISGLVICTVVLDLAGVRDQRARGLATGVTAHGIGTARMLALDAEAGAFSGLAMGLAGLAAGVGVPLAAAWLRGAGAEINTPLISRFQPGYAGWVQHHYSAEVWSHRHHELHAGLPRPSCGPTIRHCKPPICHCRQCIM